MSDPTVADLLKRVRKIELVTRGLVRETIGGEYHSSFKGQGIDFDDFREYQPGDEVRSIDWNVTARLNHPYIKKFAEERELTVFLAVDISASGGYGSVNQSKRELAAEVAALLAFSAISNQDKVGLILFADDVELYLPPRKGSRHILRIIREILFVDPKSWGTDLRPALRMLVKASPRRALVFVLSDFIGENYESALRTAAIKHDLVAIQIKDPAEATLPAAGWVTFEDPETGEQSLVNTSRIAFRRAYHKLATAWQAERDALFKAHSIDKIELLTGQDYLPSLHAFFKSRSKHPR
ncbi:DUF58 domain-containing protein [soil metagenome]